MQQRTGALLVLASAVAFGVMPIFGKLAFEAGVGVATLLVRPLRDRRAGALGAPSPPPRLPARPSAACWSGRWRSGAVGYAMQAGLYFLALERMDASVLSLVLYSYPALVTGAAILLGREAANRRRLVALVIASGGLVLVLAGAGAGSLDLAGMALGAGAALTYTTYILVSDGVTSELDALPLAALVSTGAAVSLGARGRRHRHAGPRLRRLRLGLARPRGAGLDRRRGRAVLQRHEPRRPVDRGDPLDARAARDRRARVPHLRRGARRRPAARRARRPRRGRDRQPASRAQVVQFRDYRVLFRRRRRTETWGCPRNPHLTRSLRGHPSSRRRVGAVEWRHLRPRQAQDAVPGPPRRLFAAPPGIAHPRVPLAGGAVGHRR